MTKTKQYVYVPICKSNTYSNYQVAYRSNNVEMRRYMQWQLSIKERVLNCAFKIASTPYNDRYSHYQAYVLYLDTACSELNIHGRLTSVNCVIKK